MIAQVYNLRLNPKAREWCKLPYPDHPKGCPNYDKKATCPPKAPLFCDFVEITKPVYMIAVGFDLAQHVDRMKGLHTNWTDRQARCVLYWQGGVNKILRNYCNYFLKYYPETVVTTCPEAMGVNVIETARYNGLPVELKPIKNVFKIALAGIPVLKEAQDGEG
jgi:predicted metal-binding protein